MSNDQTSPIRYIIRISCFALALLAVALWERSGAVQPGDHLGIPRIGFASAAANTESLVQQFLWALAANDRNAIERLRVDETEYRTLVMPGSVKPGMPPQIMPEESSKYFWQRHNTLNLYTVKGMLKSYGGRSYRLERVEGPAPEPLAWYTVHRDRVLYMRDENDHEIELRLGSVAEHNGALKFISYWVD